MINSISVSPQFEEYSKISELVDNALDSRKIPQNSPTRSHAHLVVEELFTQIVDFTNDPTSHFSGEITAETKHGFAANKITFIFKGNRINIWNNEDVSTMILREFEDRISCNYRDGFNIVDLTFSTGMDDKTILYCIIALGLGALIGILNYYFGNESTDNTIFKIEITAEQLFFLAIALISAPITFCSIVVQVARYCTIVNHKIKVHTKYLFFSTINSSIIAVSLGCLAAFLLKDIKIDMDAADILGSVQISDSTLTEMLTSFVPQNIFEPFISMNVVPLIFMAIILGIALGTTALRDNLILKITESLFKLLTNMQSLISSLIPIAMFFAAMDMADEYGALSIPLYLCLIISELLATIVLCGVYLGKVKLLGGSPKEFWKNTKGACFEGLKIGSSLDSIPTMTRCLMNNYHLDWDYLKVTVPFSTNVIMDANCVVMTGYIMVMIPRVGTELSLLQYLTLFFIIIALSVGAPNQPGSIIICMTVLFAYLGYNMRGYYCIFIFMEAFVSRFMVASNNLGVMSSVYLESKRKRK